MFGGIAAARDALAHASFDGTVVLLDPDRKELVGQLTVYPSGPARVHVSVCAEGAAGALLLGDARHRRVRVLARDGRPLGLVGARPNPGLEEQDDPGVLHEPCALLPLEDQLVVACGGFGMRHGVQCFRRDGTYLTSFAPPPEGWRRAQGLALVDDAIWVAETEAGRIRRHARDGSYLDDVALHPDLRRPFRLRADGYGGVLLLLAPESDEEQELYGVARLDAEGGFEGWVIRPGDEQGRVYCPFDVAVLADGRIVVADLPLGKPPEVRLQLFSTDGRLLATLVEGSDELAALQRAWFESVLARDAADADTLYEQARVHHFYAGATRDHLREADGLYRAALAAEPGHYLARVGRATLLQRGLDDPAGAEAEYRRAIEATGAGGEGDLLARIAECRRAEGDLDGAIRVLQRAIEAAHPPEDYHDRVEELGSYYLERAGETP